MCAYSAACVASMPVSSGGVLSSDWVSSTGDASDDHGDGLSPSSLISAD
jgi:hypothetical protein